MILLDLKIHQSPFIVTHKLLYKIKDMFRVCLALKMKQRDLEEM